MQDRKPSSIAGLSALLRVPGTLIAWLVGVIPGTAAAQEAPPQALQPPVPASQLAYEIFTDGEYEKYLRTLQNVGVAANYPWSVRGFSPREADALLSRDAAHPWEARFSAPAVASGVIEFGFLRPEARMIFNSAFPYGGNDGPLWAGRGITTSVQVGGYARWGPLSLVVAPIAFRAENAPFELAESGSGDPGIYRDPLTPGNIDLPQRFGADPYARIDPGASTLRIDLGGVAAGISTAAQHWGPTQDHPLLIGSNAGGFPHLFLATSRPAGIWIGTLHMRMVVGRLEQSRYSPSSTVGPRRILSGTVFAFQPRGVPGLEIGAGRTVSQGWRGADASSVIEPLLFVFRPTGSNSDFDRQEDQIASVFARWNLPGAGFEIFGEVVRQDFAEDARVLSVEFDDLIGYTAGFRRVWKGSSNELTVLRAEVMSTASSHRERGGARPQNADRNYHPYRHSQLRQGHTHRGQLLVSPAAHGGGARTLGLDRYTATGRWTIELERRLERDRKTRPPEDVSGDVDISYALGGSLLRTFGPAEVEFGARGVYNLNRYLLGDAFNLSLSLSGRVEVSGLLHR